MTMFYAALLFGLASAVGVFIVLLRCPRMWVLQILGYAWVLDIFCSSLMFAMHWGTAVGGFSAVIAGLFCSVGITACKCSIGYLDHGTYRSGWFGDCRPLSERASFSTRPPI